jgi:hypothetical protein
MDAGYVGPDLLLRGFAFLGSCVFLSLITPSGRCRGERGPYDGAVLQDGQFLEPFLRPLWTNLYTISVAMLYHALQCNQTDTYSLLSVTPIK